MQLGNVARILSATPTCAFGPLGEGLLQSAWLITSLY